MAKRTKHYLLFYLNICFVCKWWKHTLLTLLIAKWAWHLDIDDEVDVEFEEADTSILMTKAM